MGGQRGGAGSTTVAGASTTVIDVQVGHGTRYAEGGACVVYVAGRPYMREIGDVTGDNLTLKMALPAAPGAGINVLNCATFYIVPASVGGAGDSLAFRFLGEDTEDYWLYRGVAGTFTVETGVDEQLVLALSARAADWDRDDSIGPVASGTHVGGGPLDWRWGEVQLGTPGSTTIKVFRFSEVSLNPGLSLLEDRGPDGVETVRRWWRADPPDPGPDRPHDGRDRLETYQDEYDPTTAMARAALGHKPRPASPSSAATAPGWWGRPCRGPRTAPCRADCGRRRFVGRPVCSTDEDEDSGGDHGPQRSIFRVLSRKSRDHFKVVTVNDPDRSRLARGPRRARQVHRRARRVRPVLYKHQQATVFVCRPLPHEVALLVEAEQEEPRRLAFAFACSLERIENVAGGELPVERHPWELLKGWPVVTDACRKELAELLGESVIREVGSVALQKTQLAAHQKKAFYLPPGCRVDLERSTPATEPTTPTTAPPD
jgi:hypothetical protein